MVGWFWGGDAKSKHLNKRIATNRAKALKNYFDAKG